MNREGAFADWASLFPTVACIAGSLQQIRSAVPRKDCKTGFQPGELTGKMPLPGVLLPTARPKHNGCSDFRCRFGDDLR